MVVEDRQTLMTRWWPIKTLDLEMQTDVFRLGTLINTDYPYLRQFYPQQFPVGSHEQIIRTDGLGFETSALARCYYHLVTLRLMEYKWGWNPHKLFSTTNDPSAYDRVVSYPYNQGALEGLKDCLLYTSPSPRDKRQSRMPSSA